MRVIIIGKYIGAAALAMIVSSCRSKSLVVEKSKEVELEELSRRFDSMFRHNLNHILESEHQNSLSFDKLAISSAVIVDSAGNRVPFHYKHIVDGKVKEEIYVQGGEINKEKVSQDTKATEKRNEVKAETTRIDVDVGLKHKKKSASKGKSKTITATGFQFGAYIVGFLWLILILFLLWLAKRFKLMDKVKAILLGHKKKPPNI